MSRTPIAIVAILAFALGWLVLAARVADWVAPLHWSLQAMYYMVAGFVWVFPVRWLMLWSAHRR